MNQQRQNNMEDELRQEAESLLAEYEILLEEGDNEYAIESWQRRATLFLLKERAAKLIKNQEMSDSEQAREKGGPDGLDI